MNRVSPGGDRPVRCRARKGSTRIDCTISDEGPGFRPEDLSRAFEPFFTRRRGGTGLGLSIVQRIMEKHGGRITLDNRAGEGALVTVRLPLLTAMPGGLTGA